MAKKKAKNAFANANVMMMRQIKIEITGSNFECHKKVLEDIIGNGVEEKKVVDIQFMHMILHFLFMQQIQMHIIISESIFHFHQLLV